MGLATQRFAYAVSALLLVPGHARAVDLLTTAESSFFNPADDTRVGIEVEFKGLTPKAAAELVAKRLGGEVDTKTEIIKTSVKEILPDGTKVYHEVTNTDWLIKGSSIGTVVLKPDLNQIDDYTSPDAKNYVTELVTEPIRIPAVNALQKLMEDLHRAGAIGTTDDNAVSIQVNAELARGAKNAVGQQATVDQVTNLLRNYFRPEHLAQIDARLKIPDIRKPYVQDPSPGFMKRLLDPNYAPTARQLYDDYVYRQSLELSGNPRAWTMPINEAHTALLKSTAEPIVPRVVKQNGLRISSWLMYLFPNDPMSKLYSESGWAVARPLVEFRKNNNDFRVDSATKQSLGLLQASKDYGAFDHDRLVAEFSGLDTATIAKLRAASQQHSANPKLGPVVFRYILGDPQKIDRTKYQQVLPAFDDTVVGFLSADSYGQKPAIVPGESVVYHRRPIHRTSIQGKYNPGLVNANLQQALENKYVEAKFWDEYAPGAMPTTLSFEDFKPDAQNLPDLLKRLHQRFPGGWVLKGAWDLGSENDIITDQTDVLKEIETYRHSDFDAFRAEALKQANGAAPELLLTELKKRPGYKGWQITNKIRDAQLALVQEKVPIEREFRVEVVGGKVLGQGTTLDRYYYQFRDGENGKKPSDYVAPDKKVFQSAEAFAQAILNKLPKELRGMPMGMDVAWLGGDKFSLIESNPGGNSNFIAEEEPLSIRVLAEFLKKYPQLLANGEVHPGLSPPQQMKYLQQKFGDWGIDTKKLYPGIVFTPDHLADAEFKAVEVNPKHFELSPKHRPGPSDCRAWLGRALQ